MAKVDELRSVLAIRVPINRFSLRCSAPSSVTRGAILQLSFETYYDIDQSIHLYLQHSFIVKFVYRDTKPLRTHQPPPLN